MFSARCGGSRRGDRGPSAAEVVCARASATQQGGGTAMGGTKVCPNVQCSGRVVWGGCGRVAQTKVEVVA